MEKCEPFRRAVVRLVDFEIEIERTIVGTKRHMYIAGEHGRNYIESYSEFNKNSNLMPFFGVHPSAHLRASKYAVINPNPNPNPNTNPNTMINGYVYNHRERNKRCE
jgi:hypothetical protein